MEWPVAVFGVVARECQVPKGMQVLFVDTPPVLAEVLVQQGQFQIKSGDSAGAEVTLLKASAAAAAAHSPELEVRAWTGLTLSIGYGQSRLAEGLLASRAAEAGLARVQNKAVEAEWANATGAIFRLILSRGFQKRDGWRYSGCYRCH